MNEQHLKTYNSTEQLPAFVYRSREWLHSLANRFFFFSFKTLCGRVLEIYSVKTRKSDPFIK